MTSSETKDNGGLFAGALLVSIALGFAIGVAVAGIWNTRMAVEGVVANEARLQSILSVVAPELRAVAVSRHGDRRWVAVEGIRKGKPFRVTVFCRDIKATPPVWQANPHEGDPATQCLAEDYMATDPLIEAKEKDKEDERWVHTWSPKEEFTGKRLRSYAGEDQSSANLEKLKSGELGGAKFP